MSELREKLTAEYSVYKILLVKIDGFTEIFEKRYNKALSITNFHFEQAEFTIPFVYSGISPDLSTLFYTAILVESEDMEGQDYLQQLKKEIEHEGWIYQKTEKTTKQEAKSYSN